jgi:hypothetical protein
VLQAGPFDIEVIDMDARRIDKLILRKRDAPGDAAPSST